MIDASSRAEILGLLRDLGGARRDAAVHHPRPRERPALGRPDRGDVRGAGRGGGARATLIEHRSTRTPGRCSRRYRSPTRRTARGCDRWSGASHPRAPPTGCTFHPRCPAFIAGTCDVIDPPLVRVSGGGLAACHHEPAVGEGDAAGDPKPPGRATRPRPPKPPGMPKHPRMPRLLLPEAARALRTPAARPRRGSRGPPLPGSSAIHPRAARPA